MKITLEYPFTEYWDHGYIVCNAEPRWHVILYNSPTQRSTISYARYLISVWLGQFLLDEEIVDHINNDQLDDRFENLQIITSRENTIKGMIENGIGRRTIQLICGCCGTYFERPYNLTHLVECNSNRKSTYCSRSCGSKSSVSQPSIVLGEYVKFPTIGP